MKEAKMEDTHRSCHRHILVGISQYITWNMEPYTLIIRKRWCTTICELVNLKQWKTLELIIDLIDVTNQ